jgi:hypothetical protein
MRLLSVLALVLVLSLSCTSVNQHQAIPTEVSHYGFSADNPIYCGDGLEGEKKYISKLRGPQGQWVKATPLVECCYFDLPNGQTGHISRWEVRYAGMLEPVIIYLNSFQTEPVYPPVGFAMAY